MVAAIMSGERGVCEGWKCVHEEELSLIFPTSTLQVSLISYIPGLLPTARKRYVFLFHAFLYNT